MPFRPIDEPLPVLPLEETQAPRPKPVSSFKPLLGGQQAAIERPEAPTWLQNIEQWGVVPAGGALAAAATLPVSLPVALATGQPLVVPVAGATGFGLGATATNEAVRRLNKALGYRVPRQPTTGEAAVEFGTQALSVPVGGLLGEAVGPGVKRFIGFTARQKALQEATEDMTRRLDYLPKLHEDVLTKADEVTGNLSGAERRATTMAREEAEARTAAAPEKMVAGAGVAPISDLELEARAKSHRVSGLLRRRDVAPVQELYRTMQQDLGNEFENMLKGDVLNQSVPEDPLGRLGQRGADIKQNVQQYPIGSPVAKLVDEVASWTPQSVQQGMIAGQPIALPQGATSGGQPIQIPSTADVKWARLKKLRGQLAPFLQSKKPSERGTAAALDAAITDTYARGGFPVDPDLNLRYHDHRQRWTYDVLNEVYNARIPEELSKKVINENTLGPFLSSRSPRARQIAANLVGRAIRTEQLTPSQILQRFSPRILRDIFGPGADDVTQWARMDAMTVALPDLFRSQPSIGQEFVRNINDFSRRIYAKGAREIKTKVVASLRKLGPPAAKLTSEVANMRSEDAVAYYLNEMTKPEFGQRLIAAARHGTPMPSANRWRGIGSLGFAAGLAASEIFLRGEITSPYAISVLGVGAAEISTRALRNQILRVAETEGMQNAIRLLNRVWSPATRHVAMKQLARRMGQAAVSGIFRAGLTPTEEEPGTQPPQAPQTPQAPQPTPQPTPTLYGEALQQPIRFDKPPPAIAPQSGANQ